MKESLLRETIRKEIRKSLKEQDVTGRAETGISRLEKQPGIKMLKTALSSGTPKQQAAGLLKVINLVSGGARAVKSQLVQMLQQGGLEAEEPAAEPVTEAPDKTELRMGQFKDAFKTQMKGKPANDQINLVIGLVKDLDLKGNQTTFLSKLRSVLKAKK